MYTYTIYIYSIMNAYTQCIYIYITTYILSYIYIYIYISLTVDTLSCKVDTSSHIDSYVLRFIIVILSIL